MVFYFVSRRFKNRHSIILIFSLFIIFAGIIPSLIDRNIKTAFLGMTFMGIILYNYYSELTKQDLSDEIAAQNERIKNMQSSTIIGIATLIESRDSNTGTHVKNTSNYVSMLARAAQKAGIYPETINDNFVKLVESAAPLHDIGKIAVPDRILNKPGKLTDEEFEQIKIHASEGGKLILQVLEDTSDQEYIKVAYEVATYHHEKWNGKGYPKGLSGEEIPVSARIMAIADVYDALTMERVYKKAFPVETALSIISEDAGKHFDPLLAPLFVNLMKSIWI
jgi:HD-GYP domain-containing protein (c-di-GMP phosphodiesterase class II)